MRIEYKLQEWNGGKVWVEEAYPNILFAKDGEIYDIAGMKTIVIGGAYSVDKFYRLSRLLHTSIEDILVIDGDIVRLWGFSFKLLVQ